MIAGDNEVFELRRRDDCGEGERLGVQRGEGNFNERRVSSGRHILGRGGLIEICKYHYP